MISEQTKTLMMQYASPELIRLVARISDSCEINHRFRGEKLTIVVKRGEAYADDLMELGFTRDKKNFGMVLWSGPSEWRVTLVSGWWPNEVLLATTVRASRAEQAIELATKHFFGPEARAFIKRKLVDIRIGYGTYREWRVTVERML